MPIPMEPGSALLLPGASNALAARVIEMVGFDALLVTGAGVANTYLGVPDIGLVTMKEVADHIWAIRDAVSISIIADADTGFGNAVNVGRTVSIYERAGADCIMIEDQVFPKKCGHFAGKAVISRAEMVQKIKAAVDARKSEGTWILARTDAIAVEGFESAIERAEAYSEAGADVLFIEAPVSLEQMVAIPKRVPGRHICNLVIGGKTPLVDRAGLSEMGYAGIYYANVALQASLFGMNAVLSALVRDGSIDAVRDLIVPFDERQKYVNFDHYRDLERRYVDSVGATNAAAE